MDFIFSLFGRFHPVLVHLPIGFLILGGILVFYAKKESKEFLPAIRISFFWGTIAALFSVVSGLLLYLREGYSFDTVSKHLILGVLTTLFSFGFYLYLKNKVDFIDSKVRGMSVGLMILLMLTGHFGGELTHGSDYFTQVLPEKFQEFFGISNASELTMISLDEEHWGEAIFYQDVIHPILSQNCNSCHNEKNKKGELVLNSPEWITKGGKNGKVLDSKVPLNSTLLARMLLPHDDKEHMPPKDKRQPSKQEIALIHKWIEAGASFEVSLAKAGVKEEMINMYFPDAKDDFYPETELAKLGENVLLPFRKSGLLIEPISQESPLLKISAINFHQGQKLNLKDFQGIASHIAYLDISGTDQDDAVWNDLVAFKNLTVLKINRVDIEGQGIEALHQLTNLKRLNLNDSDLQLSNLLALEDHPSLEGIFFYATPASKAISSDEIVRFLARLEYGGYELPVLSSDTVVY
ncbi:c-type cytochrome domain-containing protein [Cecembia rubra]|uniref:Putative membrane protein n=1 Tax=Cecembia rubra TaxID=1485585 RepID=A0A2P8DRI5_9BACT|nr:c-type cytochrome domain-containing protein [Cecembia rubra]PSK99825.1 putative membrane protein [Cecembia rubra]